MAGPRRQPHNPDSSESRRVGRPQHSLRRTPSILQSEARATCHLSHGGGDLQGEVRLGWERARAVD